MHDIVIDIMNNKISNIVNDILKDIATNVMNDIVNEILIEITNDIVNMIRMRFCGILHDKYPKMSCWILYATQLYHNPDGLFVQLFKEIMLILNNGGLDDLHKLHE